ncbi:MAG TPA: septation protein SepH [Streptosporangiaceae bacterium]|nr:septation protein SepH [Streptosporangiaceae bacterium]
MQELRLVAVSEDGTYAVLAAPGSGGRFSLPVDDRLRVVARGQFSRLAQYQIEVESPLRPKEIQDRIRAGETADEIADAAGVPVERIRRFEGPVLAEREYRAQEAQRATVRSPGDSGPGPRLGDVVAERLTDLGASPEDAQWDSKKRADGNWQVHLMFTVGGRAQAAEWVFDPRRRHIAPDDDQAARLCLPPDDLAGMRFASSGPATPTATVTPIASRLGGGAAHHPEPRGPVGPPISAAAPGRPAPPAPPVPAGPAARPGQAREADGEHRTADREAAAADRRPDQGSERPVKKAAGGRPRRASVPSWDEIMLGNSRQPD